MKTTVVSFEYVIKRITNAKILLTAFIYSVKPDKLF